MDSVSSVSVYSENIQATQPFLTKRGLVLQGGNTNSSLRAKKDATQETASPPQTLQKNAIDIKI